MCWNCANNCQECASLFWWCEMCGRFAAYNRKSINELLDELGVGIVESQFTARYNVSPSASINVVINRQKPVVADMSWGLQAEWMKAKGMHALINARAETIHEKTSFKNLIIHSRAVIPVNGFYEWRRENTEKHCYYFEPCKHQALALGAIYQQTRGGEMQACIITTPANAVMAPVHDRMPVILAADSMREWLTTDNQARVDALMQPCPDDWIRTVEVSSYVNSSRNEGVKCITALHAG